jgi:hypothetical protein
MRAPTLIIAPANRNKNSTLRLWMPAKVPNRQPSIHGNSPGHPVFKSSCRSHDTGTDQSRLPATGQPTAEVEILKTSDLRESSQGAERPARDPNGLVAEKPAQVARAQIPQTATGSQQVGRRLISATESTSHDTAARHCSAQGIQRTRLEEAIGMQEHKPLGFR